MIAPVTEIRRPTAASRERVVTRCDRSTRSQPDRGTGADDLWKRPQLVGRESRGGAGRRPGRARDRRRGGRRRDRHGGLGAVRARNGLRDHVGRRHVAGMAWAGDLPHNRRKPGEPGRRAQFSLHRGRRFSQQPADPRASRLHIGDDDHVIRLVAAHGCSRSAFSAQRGFCQIARRGRALPKELTLFARKKTFVCLCLAGWPRHRDPCRHNRGRAWRAFGGSATPAPTGSTSPCRARNAEGRRPYRRSRRVDVSCRLVGSGERGA